MSDLLKLSNIVVAWTPDLPTHPEGCRGTARFFPAGTPEREMATFPYRAGCCHPRGQDPREEVRQAYALEIALAMCTRDNLDVFAVHRMMLCVEEYAEGCAADLVQPVGETL